MSHEAPLMVADSPAPLQAPVHWQIPDRDLVDLSRAEHVAAKWLGLVLAIVVGAGVDLIVAILQPSAAPFDATGGLALGADGIVPILAAASFGWLLGPPAARVRCRGGVAVVVAMAIGVMILGDIITVVGAVLGSLPDASTTYPLVDIGAVLVLMSLVGAMIVGPFVVVLLTLPASVVWFVVFRIAWTRVRPARATS
jgi:hypothetical protein